MQDMLMLRLVLHNQVNQPIWIEIEVDEGLKKAVQQSKVTKVDFVFFEKDKNNQIVIPKSGLVIPSDTHINGNLNKYKEL